MECYAVSWFLHRSDVLLAAIADCSSRQTWSAAMLKISLSLARLLTVHVTLVFWCHDPLCFPTHHWKQYCFIPLWLHHSHAVKEASREHHIVGLKKREKKITATLGHRCLSWQTFRDKHTSEFHFRELFSGHQLFSLHEENGSDAFRPMARAPVLLTHNGACSHMPLHHMMLKWIRSNHTSVDQLHVVQDWMVQSFQPGVYLQNKQPLWDQ